MKENFKDTNIYEERLQDMESKSDFITDSSNNYYNEK